MPNDPLNPKDNKPKRPSPFKSVRWRGSNSNDESNTRGSPDDRRRGQMPSKIYVEQVSSDSSSSDDSDDNSDSSIKQTTRANTWFNRLRSGDAEDLSGDESDRESNENENENENENDDGILSINVPPSIRVSAHHANPFANIMDIGTKTSGGLAPSVSSHSASIDSIDEEYRQRRNQLLASNVRSQPTSPTLPPIDDRNIDAIPLHDMRPSATQRREFTKPIDNSSSSADASAEADDPVSKAELYRQEVEKQQKLRQRAINRIIDKQKAKQINESASKEGTPDLHAIDRTTSNNSGRSRSNSNTNSNNGSIYVNGRKSSDSTSVRSQHSSNRPTLTRTKLRSLEEDDSDSDDERKRLKDLEEANKLQAEQHARDLVSTHIGTTLLGSHKDDGYVPNNDFALNIGLDDDNLSAMELSEPEKQDDSSKGDSSSRDDDKDKKIPHNTQHTASESDDESLSSVQREANLRGDPDYVPPPKKVKEGVLGSLLKLYAGQEEELSPMTSTATSPAESPLNTPMENFDASNYLSVHRPSQFGPPESSGPPGSKHSRRPSYLRTYSSEDALGREAKGRPKWYKRASSSYVPSLQKIASGATDAATHTANTFTKNPLKRTTSGKTHTVSDLAGDFGSLAGVPGMIGHKGMEGIAALRDKETRKRQKKVNQQKKEKEKALKKARLAEQARITVHIADVLQRQRFLLRLGRALMLFGAPSHRLEEYLKITARVLEIDAQVLYIPGCMLVSFGDATTHTSETKLLRVTQGLNLGKLHATHLLYKEVVHDLMGLEEASSHIDHLLSSKDLYPWWLVVIFYGIACLSFGMYSYGGWWHDLPILFLVGGAVGFLQFWVQPRSDLYSNVFEVSSSIIVSFVGRAIGSIGHGDDRVFCFAAIVQGSLSLILPGYIILVGALELQTKNLVAGSVRMFYANIYSLFLSFGITLGSAIYGWIDSNASGETTCTRIIDPKWRILFVPAATAFIAAVNQASPRQLPVMVIVGCSGYCVLYFVQQEVQSAAAFTSAIGAFTIGILGNLYSRVGHGLAFAAMLPGIFCLVPSGVAAQGSLVAGVAFADAIVQSTDSKNNATSTSIAEQASNDITQLGSTMTQVAVGIVVGLFAATLVVYPLGFKKKRSGLFTF